MLGLEGLGSRDVLTIKLAIISLFGVNIKTTCNLRDLDKTDNSSPSVSYVLGPVKMVSQLESMQTANTTYSGGIQLPWVCNLEGNRGHLYSVR